ncbi:hypothetical protein F0562_022648 [Nyssa sinensis]|uniref:BCAS3 domain-containing protein n=1 Tax=Nyssa sinensis TaxID=561372 RepID=A0A5J5BPM3_9ASTE|nr:hypothetical protein F0562_022648 [Nyssa sinensis]
MGNGSKKTQGGLPRSGHTNGFIPTSFCALSSYLRIVSSGVSTVASTVRLVASAASAIVDRDNDASHDQVHWATFDKSEGKGDITQQVLLLGYQFGFQSYVSVIYSVHCSPRVVAVLQATQIHSFDTATLGREYTILTKPIVMGCPESEGIGYGPLAVGPKWLAYSGSLVAVSNSGRVSPQHLTPSASFLCSASNGSLFAYNAKESRKKLAVGIVTLRDMGYKKLSRYYFELSPNSNNFLQSGSPGIKVNGTSNGHFLDVDHVGMVIVRDIVSKSVITQFRAHKSPISSLCFDPSRIFLVTASVQGHNINVFQIMLGLSGSFCGSDS